ncbi:ABC transporter permease [Candidatus Enterococcus mansonii]|uniref:Uncharacterized protein n=1 Tax=Candidatus Enterococcus mansonii TaxID=1834181 RepID=A0A242CJ51_9ENTE|nr:ABC transporter permease [Enterococcus sp. 4G2_DIV0659]OTO09930.1 hypothetical protein A5880_000613 [Enterococcus sp. 4G2_DIV0659]
MIFEWKKWIKNPKNSLLLCLAILSVFVSLANLYYDNQGEEQRVFNHLKAINDEIDPPQNYTGPKENYKLLQHLNEEGKVKSEKDRKLQKLLIDIIYLLEDENTAQRQKKWVKKTEIQTKRLTLQQKYLDMGGKTWHNESQIKEQLARNRWLLKEKIQIQNLAIGQQGFYFVYYLLSHWMNYFILVMIGLFFFDFLTSEYERKNYLFMAVQPISSKIFFWRKYVMANGLFIGGMLSVLFVGFIASSLLNGMGSLMYPMVISNGTTFKLIPLWIYLLKMLILQLLFISFSIGLLLLVSKWLKNSLEALGVFLVLMLVPVILAKFIVEIAEISRWMPFSYMDTNEKIASSIGQFQSSFMIQIAVLITWNGCLALIWCWSLRRKMV